MESMYYIYRRSACLADSFLLLSISEGLGNSLTPHLHEYLSISDFCDEDKKSSLCLNFLRNFPTIIYSRKSFSIDGIIFDNVVNKAAIDIRITKDTEIVFKGFYKTTRLFFFTKTKI